LTHTLGHLDELLAWATRERAGTTVLLEHVLGAEVAGKLEGRIARRVATSGLREQKTLEAFDWNFQPTLDKAFILELSRLDFVRRHDDLVITGKSGTERATSSRPSPCAPASRPSPSATPEASISSTTSTPASPTAPIPDASRPGPAPTCSSSTTWASAR
jgi:IstB-like ATP binding protein